MKIALSIPLLCRKKEEERGRKSPPATNVAFPPSQIIRRRCRKTNKRHVLVTPNERNVSEAPYSIDGTDWEASNAFPSSAKVTNSARIANSISTSPAFDQGTTEQVATIYDVRNGDIHFNFVCFKK